MGSLTASLVLSVAYGANIKSESDKFFTAAEGAMVAIDLALLPGTFLVDFLPIRMNFSRTVISGKGILQNPLHSQIHPGVVPWSRLQDVCEDWEEGHR